MNQIQVIIAMVVVGIAGIVALILGNTEIATLCLGAEIGALSPSPLKGQ